MNNIRYLRLNRRLLHKNSFHIALTACSGTGDMITAYKIIDLMVDNDIPMRSDTFNALLDTVKKLTVMFFSILFFLFFYFFIPFYFILFSNFYNECLFQEFFHIFLWITSTVLDYLFHLYLICFEESFIYLSIHLFIYFFTYLFIYFVIIIAIMIMIDKHHDTDYICHSDYITIIIILLSLSSLLSLLLLSLLSS